MPRVLILGGTAEARLLAERLAGRSGSYRHAFARRPHGCAGAAAGAGARRRLRRRRRTRALSGRRTHRCADRRDPSLRRHHLGQRRRGRAQDRRAVRWRLRRPPWSAVAGDRWTEVSDVHAAVRALGDAPRRVFVALGRNELAPFVDAPQHHYLIRSVDPVDPPLAGAACGLRHRPRSVQRSRRSCADARARHRDRDRQEQRRHGDLRQDRRGARARHRRDPAAPAARRPRRPPWRRSRMRSRGSIMRSPRRPRAACRPADAAGARDHARLARADDDERRHVGLRRVGRIERHHADTLVRPSDRAAEDDGRRCRQMAAQAFERAAELPRPRPRDRIVERDDEAGARRGIEPALDQLPRLEIVGERERAEIMAERRADPRRDREHGGDAGHDGRHRARASSPVRFRSPRRSRPPWRRRRDRRPRRRRRCAPCAAWRARRRRARLPRGCRTRGGSCPARAGTRSR